MQSSDRIGRRLQAAPIFMLTGRMAEHGTWRKPPSASPISRPVVPKTIADLEHTLGVRLLDRSRSHGVEQLSMAVHCSDKALQC